MQSTGDINMKFFKLTSIGLAVSSLFIFTATADTLTDSFIRNAKPDVGYDYKSSAKPIDNPYAAPLPQQLEPVLRNPAQINTPVVNTPVVNTPVVNTPVVNTPVVNTKDVTNNPYKQVKDKRNSDIQVDAETLAPLIIEIKNKRTDKINITLDAVEKPTELPTSERKNIPVKSEDTSSFNVPSQNPYDKPMYPAPPKPRALQADEIKSPSRAEPIIIQTQTWDTLKKAEPKKDMQAVKKELSEAKQVKSSVVESKPGVHSSSPAGLSNIDIQFIKLFKEEGRLLEIVDTTSTESEEYLESVAALSDIWKKIDDLKTKSGVDPNSIAAIAELKKTRSENLPKQDAGNTRTTAQPNVTKDKEIVLPKKVIASPVEPKPAIITKTSVPAQNSSAIGATVIPVPSNSVQSSKLE